MDSSVHLGYAYPIHMFAMVKVIVELRTSQMKKTVVPVSLSFMNNNSEHLQFY